ncbi:MAG: divalent metal cation transporter MntH [Candidatus Nitrosocaldaceae archaeon]|nr:MAG: divalent metal cation transporter MntH [Candidatus Nitrosocaldaceae archaeon]
MLNRFSNGMLRRFIIYLGPAILVSLAYMDPGNFGTAIEAGANFNYDLVWIVWLSSLMAMLLQYLSGKIGIATGRSLAELIRLKLGKKRFIIPYWIGAEAIIAATDLAEYLGTVIALNLLFGIPLLHAAVIGAVDVLLILTLTSRRFRLLEQMFMIFVSIIGIGYMYEIIIVKPDIEEIVYHSFIPSLNDRSALVAVGVIGATVMPHALYIHSWLTKRRLVKYSIEEKREVLRLHRIENIIMLTIAGLINASIMIMSAAAFYGNAQVVTIEDAYQTLIPLFGSLAAFVFAITLLISGISSSTLGTITGQAVFEDLLSKKSNPWFRRIITRFVNVVPTSIALLIGLEPLDILVYSQVVLSLLIPLPLIPIILISKNKHIMGEFVNKPITSLFAIIFAGVIIAFNVYLLYSL